MATPAIQAASAHAAIPPETPVWISALRQAEFSLLPRLTAGSSCEVSAPPQTLATPDPLIDTSADDSRITVSFIVGTDGRVHSVIVMEGISVSEYGAVLKTVHSWRYRPAKCNGVPIDAEANIQLRLR